MPHFRIWEHYYEKRYKDEKAAPMTPLRFLKNKLYPAVKN
jgi:hypothetical protein